MKVQSSPVACVVLDNIIESISTGVMITDADGRIVALNESAERILNVRKKEVLSRKVNERLPEVFSGLQEIIEGREPDKDETISIGEHTIIVNKLSSSTKEQGLGVIVLLEDISQFVEVSEELSFCIRAVKELNAIIDSSFDGLYITDGQANTIRVNPSWEKITGLKAEDVLGKNIADLEKEGYKSVTLKVLEERKPITISTTTKTGKTLLLTGSPIFDEDGNIAKVVTNVRDMTELNYLSREVEKSKRLADEYRFRLEKLQMQQSEMIDVIANSKQMKDVLDLALRVAPVDVPVLIEGETGVGKEVVAKVIHNNSERHGKGTFLKINCGAIPETLLESELFGYEKGAFTGAREEGKKGLFEMADGGTLFLDEVEALSLNSQAKLLAAIQDLEIMRIGGTKPKKINTRIVAATNRELSEMIRERLFREDLFFRLNVVKIHVPPLRERKDDIIPLAHSFLQKFNKKYKKLQHFSRGIIDYLVKYPWHGNVRELSNLIESLVVMTKDDGITPEDLPEQIRSLQSPGFSDFNVQSIKSLKDAVSRFEYNLIKEAMAQYGNARRAAKFLQIHPSAISRKIKRYKS